MYVHYVLLDILFFSREFDNVESSRVLQGGVGYMGHEPSEGFLLE
jgi:hypothetical protein